MKCVPNHTKITGLLLGMLGFAAVLYAGVRFFGAHRWKAGTRELRARLDASSEPVWPQTVDFRELEDLPSPVRRYFRLVLKDGQPTITGTHLRHAGTFNTGENTDRWKPFTSDQVVATRRPGFDWDGRVAMAPGLPVRVHDAYVAGEGVLRACLLGLFPVVDTHGTASVAKGELMRYFAEAAWYPTALLPSEGVRWRAAGDRSSYATLAHGDIEITMVFTFNESGVIGTVRAEACGRAVAGEILPTPWQGRFWNYAERGGMLVPLDGEVAWVLPEGEKPYWRGHITEISHVFAR